MSHDLYSTRLYWAGTRGGAAKLHGLRVELVAFFCEFCCVVSVRRGERAEAFDFVGGFKPYWLSRPISCSTQTLHQVVHHHSFTAGGVSSLTSGVSTFCNI